MGKTLCRQNFVWVVFSMFLASALPMVQAQVLPDAAHEAGFTAVKDKRIGPFAVKNLAGSVLASGDMDDRPVLYHIWSPINDPSGLGPSVAAELARELPGTNIVVLSTATTSRLSALATQMTLDKHRTAANDRDAIRALGNPPAPAWVFVAAGGEIVALRLGRLQAEEATRAAKALFQTCKSIAEIAPQQQPGGTEQPVPEPPETEPATKLASTSPVGLNTGLVNAGFAQAIEIEIVAELNLARTRPDVYMGILNDYRASIKGNRLEVPGETTILLEEGTKAVDEAIAFLKKQRALSPLVLSRGLSLAARDHALDQGKTGQTGHTGSDRSTMGTRIERYGQWQKTAGENIAYGGQTVRDFMIQLIVDDGVPSRGHRTNIFNPEFLVVGIAVGTHPVFRTICVQNFAGGYTER